MYLNISLRHPMPMPSQPWHHFTFRQREKKRSSIFCPIPVTTAIPPPLPFAMLPKLSDLRTLLRCCWSSFDSALRNTFLSTFSVPQKGGKFSDEGFYHGKYASGCRQSWQFGFPLPEQLYFLWILARNPWISRNKKSAHTMYCIPLDSYAKSRPCIFNPFVSHLNQQLLVNGQLLQLHVLILHVATGRGLGSVGGAVGRAAVGTRVVPVIQFGGQVQDGGKVQEDGGRQLGA